MNLSDICSIIAFGGYLIATMMILTRLFHPKGPNISLVLLLGSTAMLAHALSESLLLFSDQTINFSLPNVISLVSLIITFCISISALRFKVNLLLPVVYGFAGVWQLVMVFIPPISQMPLMAEKMAILSHITLAIIAYCILVIATLYTFQIAYINLKLKSKNLLAVNHLPPLMQVEGQLFMILAVGTACLVASQVIGVAFVDNFITKDNAHKTILSVIALLMYATILWGHFKQGWRGHRVLILTVSATSLLTLAYFGSRFVKEFLLS